MGSVKNIAKKIGMDKSIAYSSGARVIQGLTGVVSIFFITTFLTGIEQGFYYTFGSIIALQVFFELGLTGIMTQYVAHEASYLQLDDKRVYCGEEKYRSRLASLLYFCVKWYSVLAVVVFLFLLIVGNVYFVKYGDSQASDIEWKLPWLFISFGTGLKLFQSPLTSILAGLGFVKETSKITFYQQLITPIATWIGLICGFKLYVIGIGYLLSILIWFIYVYKEKLVEVITNLWSVDIIEKVDYSKEILPYQWRIAISWISGYFIFQLFNPVLFATEGAVVAGQMGMTLQALNAIQSFSMSWLNTKIPLYSRLIAQRDYIHLDRLFSKTLRQMSVVCTFLLFVFVMLVLFLRISQIQFNGTVLATRFLGYWPLVLMCVPVFLQQFTNSWATYLRCHKKEPYLFNSIVNGGLCMASTFILGKMFGLYGVTIGYCVVQVVLFPWGYWLYVSNKKRWHER